MTFPLISSPLAGSTPASADVQIAVNPVDDSIATLLFNASGDLVLATSPTGLPGTWDLTTLSGPSSAQTPDLAFDSLGNLYVTYYDAGDQSLHLKTTLTAIPEPASATGLFGLLALFTRRRADCKRR